MKRSDRNQCDDLDQSSNEENVNPKLKHNHRGENRNRLKESNLKFINGNMNVIEPLKDTTTSWKCQRTSRRLDEKQSGARKKKYGFLKSLDGTALYFHYNNIDFYLERFG